MAFWKLPIMALAAAALLVDTEAQSLRGSQRKEMAEMAEAQILSDLFEPSEVSGEGMSLLQTGATVTAASKATEPEVAANTDPSGKVQVVMDWDGEVQLF